MHLRRPTLTDLDSLLELEARSYPADEAASRESLAYRISNAPACFRLAEDGGGLLGFVCGTLSRDEHLLDASMSEHHADGASLCIHSVVVDPDRRRKGVGRALVGAYLDAVAPDLPDVTRVLLICKEHLKAFYASNGFELVGLSEVVHGQDPWFEMRRPLGA